MFRAGIYAGWTGFNNLGEEAVFQLCRQRFPTIHWSSFNSLDYTAKPGQFIRQRGHDFNQIRRVVSEELSTGRRLRGLAVKTKLRVARFAGGEAGICGGDVFINRNALSLRAYSEVRKRTGAPVPVFGTGVAHADFWSARDPGWVDRRREWTSFLEELPVVGVRGPYSKAYLEEAGARNVMVCGDPAVMLHARYKKGPDRIRPHGLLRIGINAGAYPITWGRPDEIRNSVIVLAQWLRKAGHQIEILPAWSRDEAACLEVARKAGLDRSAVLPVRSSHEDFLNQVENLDLMVAWNLHTGILAAAANVPFVSLDYQPKCRDFAASIGWEDFLVKADQIQPEILIDRVSSLISQLDVKRTELCREMCRMMNTFENYCQDIEPLLLGKK